MVSGMEVTDEAGEIIIIPFSSILYITKKKIQGSPPLFREESLGKDAIVIKTSSADGRSIWVTDADMMVRLWDAFDDWMGRPTY